ncbi:BREX system serine/threonine kinase PglW [Microbispora rosea]|uniref:BREX system serine/threonine kinase PglW n=1 Tax=Microbispora rosea TaxID=58117 RepID=UPI0004C45055|nr:BREX system serine/threonine kinase PglW [Microbispora rosea]
MKEGQRVAAGEGRWNQEFPSPFPWEQEGLDHVRSLMPDVEPYRAWATFTFSTPDGRSPECDLLVCAPAGLFLIEMKSHPGKLVNHGEDGKTWIFHRPGGKTSRMTNPFSATDRKAKELKGRLRWAARELGVKENLLPFIDAAVFLSDPGLVVELDQQQRIKVFGREGGTNGLPQIWSDLINRPPRSRHDRVKPEFDLQLSRLMRKIGVEGSRRWLRIGRWEMDSKPIDAGPDWEDRLARDADMVGDQRRIRIYLSRRLASAEDQRTTERAARREYTALLGLTHRGIVQVADYQVHEAGPAVFFRHKEDDERLDHYLDQYGETMDLVVRLDLVRQLAEALNYAHQRHLFHRALAARCVWVSAKPDGSRPVLRIGDWRTATHTSDSTGLGSLEPTSLSGRYVSSETHVYLAPEFTQPDADPLGMDVFGLGALAHLIVTGKPPSPSRREMFTRLKTDSGLLLSTLADGIPAALDTLVWQSTQPNPQNRIHDVSDVLTFLRKLDEVQRELVRVDDDETDPLDLVTGQVIDGEWQVVRPLGTGSTARALLVKRLGETTEEEFRVLKVALDEEKAETLWEEAAVLRRLHDSHVVRWLEGPTQIAGRMVMAVEQAGEESLGQRIRDKGPCSIHELERFGDDLFAALDHLAGRQIWHRDVKPENLGVRRRRDRSQELVLFDFSHSRAPERDVEVGTRAYIDPFIGTDRRPVYDAHAEWYATAVTLHEMASGEKPVWGGGDADPKFTDEELPTIAVEAFEAELRDGLHGFFARALHRDTDKRFQTLREMRDAWRSIFTQLDTERPPTTAATADTEAESTEEARDLNAAKATLTTPLREAGLSPRAVAAAAGLGAQTVGELLAVPAYKVTKVRGVGRTIRNELLRRIRQWKPLAETVPDGGGTEAEAPLQIQIGYLDDLVLSLLPGHGHRTSKEADVVRLSLRLPDASGKFPELDPWPTQKAVGALIGASQVTVSRHWRTSGDRWLLDDRVTRLREDVLDLLGEASRIMEASELAVGLLERRGARAEDERTRLAYAYAAAMIAVETERRTDKFGGDKQGTEEAGGPEPRLDRSRHGTNMIIGLESLDDQSLPNGAELIDYAVRLGRRADELAMLDPLPGPLTVLRELRGSVKPPRGLPTIPDSRLVALAAAASVTAAATARQELYPRDLGLDRALKLTQGAINPGPDGLDPEKLLALVKSRFPESTFRLGQDPTPRQVEAALVAALDKAGLELILESGRFYRKPVSGTISALSFSASRTRGAAPRQAVVVDSAAMQRLTGAAGRGGFLALNVDLRRAVLAVRVIPESLDVMPIDVGGEFLRALTDLASERDRPWSDVLRADERFSRDGILPRGLAGYVREAWQRLATRLSQPSGTVLLHNAGVFARYPGGRDLLVEIQQAARFGRGGPRGVWLLCPTGTPKQRPILDGLVVEVIGENEWLELTAELLRSLDEKAA